MRRKFLYIPGALFILLFVVGCAAGKGQTYTLTPTASSSTNAVPSPTSAVATPTATAISIATKIPTPTPVPPSPTPTSVPAPRPTPVPTIVPTTPSGNNPPGYSPDPTPQEAQLTQQLFNQINSDRAAQGLPPYTFNATMSAGARLHNWNMTKCGLSHQCPNEAPPCDRVTNEGISWTSCGENVGYSSPYPTAWGGVQTIEQSMLNEQPPNDGHRKNLLSSSFHRIGVSVLIDSKGLVWVTEDFAS